MSREIPIGWVGSPVYLLVDPSARFSSGNAYGPSREGERGTIDGIAERVHVISRPAGGEIRGYWLQHGEIWHDLPDKHPWPELDVLVCAALGLPVPARWREALALADAAVSLVATDDEGTRARIDVTWRTHPVLRAQDRQVALPWSTPSGRRPGAS